MPRKDKSSRLKEKRREKIKIHLPGFKFTSTDPTSTTIIILSITLAFLLALVIVWIFFLSIEKRKSAILEGVNSSLNIHLSERQQKGVRVKKGLVVIIRLD
jgi:hypothetical protein